MCDANRHRFFSGCLGFKFIIDAIYKISLQIYVSCHQAKNGIEALEFLATNKCDVILMDYQMPYMTGIESLQKIRESHPHVVQPVVLLFSSGEDLLNEEAFSDLGLASRLVKPVKMQQLVNTLSDLY